MTIHKDTTFCKVTTVPSIITLYRNLSIVIILATAHTLVSTLFNLNLYIITLM